ncbi:MAG: hypothetical protein AAB874_05260 [Patescibacteria group bacterium]
MRGFGKSIFRGGMYHVALIYIAGLTFNWGFFRLTGIDIVGRVFAGVQINTMITAAAACVSAVIVLWNNWVD